MNFLPFVGANFFEELALLANELADDLKEKFAMDMSGFENFNFTEGSLITVQGVVFGICIGMIIASVITVFDKKYLGALVRTMIEKEIFSPEKAQTLEELGFLRQASVRAALKGGNVFRGWVHCVEEEEYFAEMQKKREEHEERRKTDPTLPKLKEQTFKIKPESMHFYLPEDKQYAAEVKFDAKGANFVVVIFIAVLALALGTAFCALLPDMLHLADNFISMFK